MSLTGRAIVFATCLALAAFLVFVRIPLLRAFASDGRSAPARVVFLSSCPNAAWFWCADYEYEVGGDVYRGRMHCMPSTRMGDRLTIHYLPQHPASSFAGDAGSELPSDVLATAVALAAAVFLGAWVTRELIKPPRL